MPRTIPEWLAIIAVFISAAWVYTNPDYEPAIALIASILTFVGLRSRTVIAVHRALNVPSSPTLFDVKALINGAYQNDRLTIVRENLEHLAAISPDEFPSVLSSFYSSDRLPALKLLSKKLNAHPNAKETERILGTLYTNDRPDGAKALVAQVASNLAVVRGAPEDARPSPYR